MKTTRTATKTAPAVRSFRMLPGYRPQNGAALFAHSAAFFELTGMLKGKPVPKATLVEALGARAVQYHMTTTNFFEQNENGVTLTGISIPYFTDIRRVDPELKAAFLDILTTGKTARPLSTTYTNPLGVKAI